MAYFGCLRLGIVNIKFLIPFWIEFKQSLFYPFKGRHHINSIFFSSCWGMGKALCKWHILALFVEGFIKITLLDPFGVGILQKSNVLTFWGRYYLSAYLLLGRLHMNGTFWPFWY